MIRIQLSIIGDALINKDIHNDDKKTPLNSHMNKHECCAGFFHKNSASKTHDRYVCDKCGFSFVVPKEVGTFEELETYITRHGHFPE